MITSNKESERVTVLEERGNESGPMRFKKVEIKYSDGDLYYRGWIQDFGDQRTGPTFFEQNYKNYNLDREVVSKKEHYWQAVDDRNEISFRDATPKDLDDMIDLGFQNYFEGGHNRISAYQSLNHKFTNDFLTLGATVADSVYGFLYIDLTGQARGEAYFDNLYCAPAVRGRGIGDRLIDCGLERVKTMGFTKASGRIIGNLAHCRRIVAMLNQHGFKVTEHTENTPEWIDVFVVKTF